jgi:hypothetical protein
MVEHTDDCAGYDAAECEPIDGQWDQPPAQYVEMATVEIGDIAPWCQVRVRAFELARGDGR